MATPKCPKCDGSRFELNVADNIQNARFKMNFINCSSCGAVVGVVDYQHVPTLLSQIAKKLGLTLN